jgi:hypothetical protein
MVRIRKYFIIVKNAECECLKKMLLYCVFFVNSDPELDPDLK